MLRRIGDATWLSQGIEVVLRRSDEGGEVMRKKRRNG